MVILAKKQEFLLTKHIQDPSNPSISSASGFSAKINVWCLFIVAQYLIIEACLSWKIIAINTTWRLNWQIFFLSFTKWRKKMVDLYVIILMDRKFYLKNQINRYGSRGFAPSGRQAEHRHQFWSALSHPPLVVPTDIQTYSSTCQTC